MSLEIDAVRAVTALNDPDGSTVAQVREFLGMAATEDPRIDQALRSAGLRRRSLIGPPTKYFAR